MRHLASVGLCLFTSALLGCNNETRQPASPPDENGTQTTAVDKPAEANGNEGFDLDVEVGQGGVRVETEGPDNESGVKVDVDPGGDVDVEVGKDPSGRPEGSGD